MIRIARFTHAYDGASPEPCCIGMVHTVRGEQYVRWSPVGGDGKPHTDVAYMHYCPVSGEALPQTVEDAVAAHLLLAATTTKGDA